MIGIFIKASVKGTERRELLSGWAMAPYEGNGKYVVWGDNDIGITAVRSTLANGQIDEKSFYILRHGDVDVEYANRKSIFYSNLPPNKNTIKPGVLLQQYPTSKSKITVVGESFACDCKVMQVIDKRKHEVLRFRIKHLKGAQLEEMLFKQVIKDNRLF